MINGKSSVETELVCVICGSKRKEELVEHHKVSPIVRDDSDETIPLCHTCHDDVHSSFYDTKHIKIRNSECFVFPVHNPRKWRDITVPGGRPKKGRSKVLRKINKVLRRREVAFYWAIYHYGSLDPGGVGAINRSRNIISLPR